MSNSKAKIDFGSAKASLNDKNKIKYILVNYTIYQLLILFYFTNINFVLELLFQSLKSVRAVDRSVAT